jgi:hypothetical protein
MGFLEIYNKVVNLTQEKKSSFRKIQTIFIEKMNDKNYSGYHLYRKLVHENQKTKKYQLVNKFC